MREICEKHHTPARNNPQKHTLRYYDIECPFCRIELRDAEIDRLKADLLDSGIALKDAIESIQAHKAELERYAGGVEVEGVVQHYFHGSPNHEGPSYGHVEFDLPEEWISKRVTASRMILNTWLSESVLR